jgi:hypothetical protein
MSARKAPLDSVLVARIAAAGAAGLSIAEFTGHKAALIDGACRKLEAAGTIFKGKLGHRTMRYFATDAWAKAFEASRRVADASMSTKRVRAMFSVDDPVVGYSANFKHTVVGAPARKDSDPIRTSGYSPW